MLTHVRKCAVMAMTIRHMDVMMEISLMVMDAIQLVQ